MTRRETALRYAVAFIVAVLAGCALATPFQPNATASNAATNTATASPNVSVSVPPPTTSAPAAQSAPAAG